MARTRNSYGLHVAVEDRFLVVDLRLRKRLLPEGEIAEAIAGILRSLAGEYTILFDARGQWDLTKDAVALYETLRVPGSWVLVRPQEAEFVQGSLGRHSKLLQVMPGPLPVRYSEALVFDLACLDSPYLSETDKGVYPADLPVTKEEWQAARDYLPDDLAEDYRKFVRRIEWFKGAAIEGSVFYAGAETVINARRNFTSLIRRKGSKSLLTEYCMHCSGGKLLVSPYRAYSLHKVESKQDLIIARPGVLARKTGLLQSDELEQLEYLINDSQTQESHLQAFLEKHTAVLRAMGYGHIYPQVVLEREDGTSLKPDFILEPVHDEWCDILDIKRPQVSTVVGRRDRKAFSSAVIELLAQLREYAAYFEDAHLAKRVKDRYGIKCYRPRLIGIIGRDPRLVDEMQLRRMMTSYADARILTFDQLLRMAKSRLLI